jgi:hypothetical protein
MQQPEDVTTNQIPCKDEKAFAFGLSRVMLTAGRIIWTNLLLSSTENHKT